MLFITVSRSTPTRVPTIVPSPPETLVPPITVDEMASSSYPWPASGVAGLSLDAR